MTDKTNNELNQSIEVKHCNTCKCSCKVKKERKEYVKRAQQNYRLRKLETDPNYAEKLREQKRNHIEKNKEQYNEYKRVYMREYRAKKKAEKLAASSTIDTAMEKLIIKEPESLAHNANDSLEVST